MKWEGTIRTITSNGFSTGVVMSILTASFLLFDVAPTWRIVATYAAISAVCFVVGMANEFYFENRKGPRR